MNLPASSELNFASGRSIKRLAVIFPMNSYSVTEVFDLVSVLGLLRAITAASLFTTGDSEGIARTTNDLIAHPWQIANSATADEHDRVFLKVVAFAGDVNGNFFAVGQANASDFSQRRVRLLGGHCPNLQANTLFLRAFFKHDCLGSGSLNDAIPSH